MALTLGDFGGWDTRYCSQGSSPGSKSSFSAGSYFPEVAVTPGSVMLHAPWQNIFLVLLLTRVIRTCFTLLFLLDISLDYRQKSEGAKWL